MARVSTWKVFDLKGSAMTNRSTNAVPSLVALRRLARRLRGVGLSAAWLAGVGTAGAVVSMRTAYPRAPHATPGQSRPPLHTLSRWAPRSLRRVSHSRSGASFLPFGAATAGTTTTSGSGATPASTSSNE